MGSRVDQRGCPNETRVLKQLNKKGMIEAKGCSRSTELGPERMGGKQPRNDRLNSLPIGSAMARLRNEPLASDWTSVRRLFDLESYPKGEFIHFFEKNCRFR